ncbi:sigma-70 family RNA polymerase sigma factor [Nocardioides humilatus]|uniref:Sigma-70 family RNA polymerase sigma factor n=1 Tax=Nocardioides humilatus TaxID=2607660 RepID=A0A5B1LES3_9ACTN|nr:sigma-70 family RNA polymerase sigma factor [Nocardioides humilatus]KAA1418814.1 sigma-70 family RNA polymerase sigma factor [Nocardioides humilatus]
MRSDDDLVAAAKSGDPEAWRALYRAHAGRLLLWLETRASGLDETPEDLAAESWLVAAHKIADFHGDSSEFAGWLFGIARNHAANARRRSGRRQAAAAALPTDDRTAPGPESVFAGAEWVREALASLPARERDVITCMEVLELDAAATAEALGISAVAVRVARHRGLKRLRGQEPPSAATSASR